MKLLIVSGRSGSGKSICLRVLEDLSYYCIDNLPMPLLPALVKELKNLHANIAISIDARNSAHEFNALSTYLNSISLDDFSSEIIYLDADTETILKRFSETRRKHPLTRDSVSLREALEQEKQVLEPVQRLADKVIDTSHLTMHQLRDLLDDHFKGDNTQASLTLTLMSFGYKFGLPLDVDSIFDVRCLPNPYWEHGLSAVTGQDKAVIRFLEQQPKTAAILIDIQNYLSNWLPHFAAAHRKYLNIGIGCTGGQHRSVYITEKIAAHLKQQAYHVQIRHRELS